MEIINIKNNDNYLNEYIKLCNLEWGSKKDNIKNSYLTRIEKANNYINKIINTNN